MLIASKANVLLILLFQRSRLKNLTLKNPSLKNLGLKYQSQLIKKFPLCLTLTSISPKKPPIKMRRKNMLRRNKTKKTPFQ